jgi:hypothetical protein
MNDQHDPDEIDEAADTLPRMRIVDVLSETDMLVDAIEGDA